MTSFYLRAAALQGASSSTTLNVGEQNILSNVDSGNANLLVAQAISLPNAGTLSSLSFYVGTAAGNLRLGLYADDGTGTKPGALLAQTASFVPVVGWNTVAVTTATLAAGTYWLAYLPSSNTLAFRNTGGTTPQSRFYSFTFGSMPATFSASPSSTASHWSFYATFLIGGSAPVAPVVNNGSFSLTVPATSGQVVGTMTASGSPTSWAITAGNALGYFAIDSTGKITVTAAGASGLVAGSYSLTCSATNAAGSGTGTAAITAAVAGILPAGVTLQAIDGETMLTSTTMSLNYYSRNGFSFAANAATNGSSWDSPTFFPIALFYGLQDGTTADCQAIQALNVNVSDATFGSGAENPNLSTYKIWIINGASGGGPSEPTWQDALCCGLLEDEVDPAASIAGVTAAKSNNRFWKMNFTWNQLASGDWGGTQLHTYLNVQYPTGTAGTNRFIDITSVDFYWMAGSGPSCAQPGQGGQIYASHGNWSGAALTADQMSRGSNYGNQIDIQRGWNPARGTLPQWLYLETADGLVGTGSRSITANEFNWSAWSAIIHGAAGLSYFYRHDSFGTGVQAQATATNLLIKQMAPVIRSPFALGYFTVSPLGYQYPTMAISSTMFNAGIDAMAKWYQGGNINNAGLNLVNGFYIVATTRASQSATNISATFAVASGATVTVVGENRTIPIVNGHFTDTFANAWTVHIYQVS